MGVGVVESDGHNGIYFTPVMQLVVADCGKQRA
jgi:hypothetical protein